MITWYNFGQNAETEKKPAFTPLQSPLLMGPATLGTPQSVNVYIAHNITAPITGTSFKIGSTVDFGGVF
jgi:hypothetical protein